MQKTFPDGDRISVDPRNEDPLIYYLIGDDWSRVVSLEVDPPYEARRAISVRSRIFPKHLVAFEGLEDVKLSQIVERLVTEMSKMYPQWTSWEAEFPDWLLRRVGRARVEACFTAVGWSGAHSSGDLSLKWTRVPSRKWWRLGW